MFIRVIREPFLFVPSSLPDPSAVTRHAARPLASKLLLLALCAALGLSLAACSPTPAGNVLAYQVAKRLGTLEPRPAPIVTGALTGTVLADGQPLPGATVVVAERLATPHVAVTDATGHYRIEGIPPGQYVPAAVAPGYAETVPSLGSAPRLVTIQPGVATETAPILLARHVTQPLPEPLSASVALSLTNSHIVTSVFPAGAAASVQAFTFTHDDATIDTLRVYLPLTMTAEARLPLLFMVYPTHVDGWESISVALASQGYALVAVSPVATRAMDIDAHAQDARIAFALARNGDLSPHIDPGPAIALGGSFSSAILHRFLRDERSHVAAWITVGGISNAFSGAADYYAGRIQLPPGYELAIPALGFADLFPLTFLSYSPVYTAGELPPTMVIHTAADHVTPIDQAYQLEAALKAAGVPVEPFYYEDVSHYLQIGEDMTDAGKEMFTRILDFIRRHQPAPAAP